MKKITFIILVLFFAIIAGAFGVSMYNSNTVASTSSSTTKNTTVQKVTFVSPNLNINELKKSLGYTPSAGSFTMSDVHAHSMLNDCYLVINNKVYDVTPYIPYHPAGAQIIQGYCGQEVTGVFAQIHSNRAWDLLKKYKIGSIEKGVPAKITKTPEVLDALAKALKTANPSMIVLHITPVGSGFLAKVEDNKKIYELHIDSNGVIRSQEASDVELNWGSYSSDKDDK